MNLSCERSFQLRRTYRTKSLGQKRSMLGLLKEKQKVTAVIVE